MSQEEGVTDADGPLVAVEAEEDLVASETPSNQSGLDPIALEILHNDPGERPITKEELLADEDLVGADLEDEEEGVGEEEEEEVLSEGAIQSQEDLFEVSDEDSYGGSLHAVSSFHSDASGAESGKEAKPETCTLITV